MECTNIDQKRYTISHASKFYKDGQIHIKAKRVIGCLTVRWEFMFGQLNVKYLRYVENVIRHDA